jgi:predicted Zn-dependent peptidase
MNLPSRKTIVGAAAALSFALTLLMLALAPALAKDDAIVPGGAKRDPLADLEGRVREHVLANGLRVLVVERREVPIVSFVTVANVGSVDEHVGITGLAHIFEHMAFKGSREIGTLDAAAEAAIMEKLERKFDELRLERAKGDAADKAKVERLAKELDALEEEAGKLVVNNEYSVIVEEMGGAGLNASTAADLTTYYCSFPSNRVELWFMLEADRFREPVLREFFKEKEVVMEERRLRTESNPIGKLIEEFLGVAFKAHPYGQPGIGHMSDIEAVTPAEARAFFKRYYGPQNLTIAVVGDVAFDDVKRLAEEYFGAMPRGPEKEPVETVEPPQPGRKTIEVESAAQPLYGVAFHKPGAGHEDDAAYDALVAIAGQGRTSRLHRVLVKEKRIALDAGAIAGLPGPKYPNLLILYALPSVGHTVDEVAAAIDEEIEKLKTAPPADAELARVKRQARAGAIRGLSSNAGLAAALASTQAILGDWREMFRSIERIGALEPADIQRVAKTCFQRKNRIEGRIVKPSEAAATPTAAGEK